MKQPLESISKAVGLSALLTCTKSSQKEKLMNNKRFLPILVVTVIGTLALGTAKPAFSADIYNANSFENFMVGPPLVNRDGWVGVPVLSPGAAVVSTDLAGIPEQVVDGVADGCQPLLGQTVAGIRRHRLAERAKHVLAQRRGVLRTR